MPKPALGKNLAQLLNGDSVGGKPPPGKVVQGVQFGRGMETLVAREEDQSQPLTRKELLPAWFFFAADALILAFICALVSGAPKPVAYPDLLFFSAATLVAALFGIAGVARSTN